VSAFYGVTIGWKGDKKEKRTCAGTSFGGLISQHYYLNPFYYFDELNISNPVPYADTTISRRKVMPWSELLGINCKLSGKV